MNRRVESSKIPSCYEAGKEIFLRKSLYGSLADNGRAQKTEWRGGGGRRKVAQMLTLSRKEEEKKKRRETEKKRRERNRERMGWYRGTKENV